MKIGRMTLLACAGALGLAGQALGAAFTAGNIVVYRIDNGTAAVSTAATPVFLDEYTTAGSLVQSIPMPTAPSGGNRALTATGDSSSEGMINLSTDGKYLMVTGYDAAPGTANVSGTNSTSVARVVGRVDWNATIDTTTALSNVFSANNIRSAASTNGTDIWVSGAGSGTQGVNYTTLGSTTAANNVNYATRSVAIYGGQLYTGSTSSSAPGRVNAVGVGLPTGATTATILTGTGAAGGASANQFVLLDLDAGVAGVDTLYLADDTGVAITKFSLVGGTWTSNGVVGGGPDDYFGLTASVSGNTVTLFATRGKGSSADELVSLVDSTGYNGAFSGTPSILATASSATNLQFKGLSFVPVPEPASLGLILMVGAALMGRRRQV